MYKERSKVLIYIVSVLSITLWGLSYIWNEQLLSLGIPVEYLVFVRSIIAGTGLFIFHSLIRKNMRMHKEDFLLFAGLALTEPTLYFVLETYGIKLTESPTYSALVISLSPIVSGIAGVLFFKERLTKVNILGTFICLAGLALVLTHGEKTIGQYFILGLGLLFLAVVVEAGYAIFTKHLSTRYSSSVIVMYQFLLGSVMLIPLMLTKGMAHFDAAVYFSWDVWKPILCLSFLCSCLAFTLWASSIKYLGVAKSSVFMAMIPVITALAGWVKGTEILTPLQWMGIGVAFLGLTLTQYIKGKKQA